MAVITTSAPTFYLNGSQVSPPAVVGYNNGYNYVARYQFTVPAGVTADTIAVNFGIATFNVGDGAEPIRYKVTTSPTSHVNAGAGSSYDGTLTFTDSGNPKFTATASGQVLIAQAGTYYLYIFPGSGNIITWSWPTAAVDVNLTKSIYQLTLNKAAHTSLEVKRGGVSLSDGASIAYGDVLNITFGADAGYEVSATLNGVSIQSGATHTVVGNVAVATTATALGLVYIDDGTQFVTAQVFIDNSTDWEQYMPYIDNGAEFELYT
jgi:hypothetical protein